MKIGVQTLFNGEQREPLAEHLAGVAKILEERSFASIWVSEHVVTFPHYDPRYPYPYNDDHIPPAFLSRVGILDPMSTVTALAMCSKNLMLAPGVAILPQRNPVYFAKEGACIDQISGGRFIAGIGLGWSAQEYEALGVPWEHRGARMNEYIELIKALWQDDVASFNGKYYQLPECIQMPKPIQRPHPPFYIGGESDPALRRVAKHAQGWVGFRMTPDEFSARLKVLKGYLSEQGRSLDDIDIVVSPADKPCDKDTLAQYAELGVSQVVMICMGSDLDSYRDAADKLAEDFIVTASRQ